jgi:hypothetical protein
MPITDKSGKVVPDPVYHPNASLALAIVRAWNEREYRERLLTFGETGPVKSPPKPESYEKTRLALQEVDVFLAQPVVLTLAQYNSGYQKAEGDVVFVLPERLANPSSTMPSAEIAMIVTPLGM